MFNTKSLNQQKAKQHHSVVYLIGDNHSDTQLAREVLLMNKDECRLINEGDKNCLHVYYSNVLGKELEVYDFPTNRHVRHCLDIYFEILPKPDLILYATDIQSQKKELQQWIQLIENDDLHIVFISNTHSLDGKQILIKKISYFFQKPVHDYVYLPNIDRHSLYECLANIGQEGISLKSYIRRVNTWSAVKSIVRKLSYFFKTNSLTTTSVV